MSAKFETASIFGSGASLLATITIAKPAGVVEGDLMVALVANDAGSGSWTPPAGWTELEDRLHGLPGSPSITYASKVAGPSEPANYTWTHDFARFDRTALIMRFSGAVAVNIDGNQDSGVITCPDVITTVANALIVRMAATDSGIIGTLSGPAGHTEVAEVSGGQVVIAAYIEDALQAVAGATGTEVITKTGFSPPQRDIGITLAIAPTPAVVLRGVGSAASPFNVASLSIPHPAGLAEGDFMVGFNVVGRSTNTALTPAGWVTIGGPTKQVAINQIAFTKVADAADVAAGSTTFSFTQGSIDGMAGAIVALIGTNIQFDAIQIRQTSTNSPLRFADGVTTIGSDAFVIVSQSNRDSVAPQAVTTLGWTEQSDLQGVGANNVAHAIYTRDALFAGPGTVEDVDGTHSGGPFVRHQIGYMVSLVGVAVVIPPGAGPIGSGPFRLLGRRWRVLGTGA